MFSAAPLVSMLSGGVCTKILYSLLVCTLFITYNIPKSKIMFNNIVYSNMKVENYFGLIKNIYEFMMCIFKYIILLAFI